MNKRQKKKNEKTYVTWCYYRGGRTKKNRRKEREEKFKRNRIAVKISWYGQLQQDIDSFSEALKTTPLKNSENI